MFVPIVHDCEMGLIVFSRSIVICEILVGTTNNELLVEIDFLWNHLNKNKQKYGVRNTYVILLPI